MNADGRTRSAEVRRGAMRPVHWLNVLAMAALAAFAAITWRYLPDRIPAHIGFDGQPTRWSEPSVLAWFGLPALALGVGGLIYWLAHMLPRRPEMINMPDRQRFLALPDRGRAPVIRRVQEFMYWCTLATTAVLGLVQVAMYRGAIAGQSGAEVMYIIVASILVGPLLLVLWSRLVGPELDRQIREHRDAREGGGRRWADPGDEPLRQGLRISSPPETRCWRR